MLTKVLLENFRWADCEGGLKKKSCGFHLCTRVNPIPERLFALLGGFASPLIDA
jgi:hypothetical protein